MRNVGKLVLTCFLMHDAVICYLPPRTVLLHLYLHHPHQQPCFFSDARLPTSAFCPGHKTWRTLTLGISIRNAAVPFCHITARSPSSLPLGFGSDLTFVFRSCTFWSFCSHSAFSSLSRCFVSKCRLRFNSLIAAPLAPRTRHAGLPATSINVYSASVGLERLFSEAALLFSSGRF